MASTPAERGPSGRYQVISAVGGEVAKSFIPNPIPRPSDLDLLAKQDLIGAANRAIGALDAISILLPSTELFVYMFVRKEAVLSSQIEGTQSTLADLLRAEAAENAPRSDDLTETSSYVSALERGAARVRDGFPLTARLFHELHGLLLGAGRGSEKLVGEYRRNQNWVGGTRPGNATHVPPPAEHLRDAMGELELFVNEPTQGDSALVRAGLAHAMFETIHPYEDGNGRMGRMLVPLMLLREGALRDPLLYISLFLKEHRDSYYELLQRTRTESAWDEWIDFFLEAVKSTANAAVDTARALTQLFERDRDRLRKARSRPTATLEVHEILQRHPVRSIPDLAQSTGLTHQTASKAIETMQEVGMVREITGRKRDRIYLYSEYVEILGR